MIDTALEDGSFLRRSFFIIVDFQSEQERIVLIGSELIHHRSGTTGDLLFTGVFVDLFDEC